MTGLEKLWVWFSQTLNALSGGAPDETFSARAHREDGKWARRIDRVLGAGHCERVYRQERERQLARHDVRALSVRV